MCRLEKTIASNGDEKKLIQMDFPLRSLEPVADNVTKESVASGLNISPDSIVEMKGTQTTDVLVRIDPSAFASVAPDFQQLATIDGRYALFRECVRIRSLSRTDN